MAKTKNKNFPTTHNIAHRSRYRTWFFLLSTGARVKIMEFPFCRFCVYASKSNYCDRETRVFRGKNIKEKLGTRPEFKVVRDRQQLRRSSNGKPFKTVFVFFFLCKYIRRRRNRPNKPIQRRCSRNRLLVVTEGRVHRVYCCPQARTEVEPKGSWRQRHQWQWPAYRTYSKPKRWSSKRWVRKRVSTRKCARRTLRRRPEPRSRAARAAKRPQWTGRRLLGECTALTTSIVIIPGLGWNR